MRALVQRVKSASVDVDGRCVGEINAGILVLLGVHKNDSLEDLKWVARKIVNLRIFPDNSGKMNASLRDIDGEALVVSQFTLYGDTRKGNRPSFTESAPPGEAEKLYALFVQEMETLLGQPVPTGIFGAMMQVELVNDGPVTLIVEKRQD